MSQEIKQMSKKHMSLLNQLSYDLKQRVVQEIKRQLVTGAGEE